MIFYSLKKFKYSWNFFFFLILGISCLLQCFVTLADSLNDSDEFISFSWELAYTLAEVIMVPRSNLHNHALLILLLMYRSPRTHSAISVDVETEYYHQALIDLLTHREQECDLKFDRFWLCVWYDLDIGASEYQWEIGLSWKNVLLILIVRSFFLKKRLFLSLKVENKTKGKLQKQICQVVLDHFEKQYTAELGDKWTSVRSVLLGKRGREERGSVSF